MKRSKFCEEQVAMPSVKPKPPPPSVTSADNSG